MPRSTVTYEVFTIDDNTLSLYIKQWFKGSPCMNWTGGYDRTPRNFQKNK